MEEVRCVVFKKNRGYRTLVAKPKVCIRLIKNERERHRANGPLCGVLKADRTYEPYFSYMCLLHAQLSITPQFVTFVALVACSYLLAEL